MRKRKRLKAYNESHKSHELTENKNNEKEQKQISLPPVRLTQLSVRTQLVDGQTTLRVDSQNTTERVLCSKRHRGQMWYKVKWWNIKKQECVDESVVPRDMQRDNFVKYTVAGRAKKGLKQTV